MATQVIDSQKAASFLEWPIYESKRTKMESSKNETSRFYWLSIDILK
jgi:hypothetical protein